MGYHGIFDDDDNGTSSWSSPCPPQDTPRAALQPQPARKEHKRVGGSAFLMVAAMLLAACTGHGGGQLGPPADSGVIAAYQGQATFGFTFACEMRKGRAVIRGQLEYHDKAPSIIGGAPFPKIAIHGVVDPTSNNVGSCEQLLVPVVQFEGIYRPQGNDPLSPGGSREGRFIVQAFDQGEPGRSSGDLTGDSFSIELIGGSYGGYTRAGYIESGNIQVR